MPAQRRRKIQSDQNADISEGGTEFAAQQRCDRGNALELECYGGANRNQNGKDSPAIAQHSIPLEAATQPETA